MECDSFMDMINTILISPRDMSLPPLPSGFTSNVNGGGGLKSKVDDALGRKSPSVVMGISSTRTSGLIMISPRRISQNILDSLDLVRIPSLTMFERMAFM